MKVLIIGRAQNSDIIISDPYVSRNHAQLIIHDNGTASIVDLNSKTGTLVNGVKISGEYKLSDHDIVKIGNSNFPWQNHLNQNADTFFDDDYEEEEFEFENTGFINKYKNLIIGFAAFLLIAGAGSVFYLKYYKKATKKEVVVEKDDKENDENNDFIVEVSDYQITLPTGFIEVKDTPDDILAQYKDKKNKIEVFIYENDKSDFKKKIKTKKDEGLLNKFKEFTLKALKKQNIVEKVKNENKKEINGIETIVLDMTLKDKKKFAKRAICNGADDIYEIYIVSRKSKKKEAVKKEIINNIIASFKELEVNDEDEENNQKAADKDKKKDK